MLPKFLIRIFKLLPVRLQDKILQIQFFRRIVGVFISGRIRIQRFRLGLLSPKSVQRYFSDDTVYWIDPKKVVYTMSEEFNIYEYRGRVIGGGWDRLDNKFDELDFYISYEERALKGTCWEQLPFYQRVLAQIEEGIPKWSCKSKQDLDRRCHAWDKLFEDMKQNGYKSRKFMEGEKGRNTLLSQEDEITINIGRHGDLLFNNGRHRLTFAKLCGVEKIPVKITVRHSEWEAFKTEIELYAERHNGKVYAPLTHIDLRTIPTQYGDQRFEMIKDNMGVGNSTLLDIGAHWGHFCHKFEEEGLTCTAVENTEENLYFLRKLKRAESRNFKIIPKSIFTLSQEETVKYDIVLALAIFHHFLKEESTFEKLKLLLNALDVNEMYFEPHLGNEPQMSNTFVNFSPEEFTDFIQENSCLNNHSLIGECEDGRLVYRLCR